MNNLKKAFSKERGITLVALVITIIILIILSTITLNMAFGEDGLIAKAQEAKKMTEQAMADEAHAMNSLLDEYANIMAENPDIPDEPDPEPDTNTTEEPKPEPEPEPQPGDCRFVKHMSHFLRNYYR